MTDLHKRKEPIKMKGKSKDKLPTVLFWVSCRERVRKGLSGVSYGQNRGRERIQRWKQGLS